MVKAVPSILAQIVEQKKLELRERAPGMEEGAEASVASRRDFARALTSRRPAIIAEIKQASPSRGTLSADYHPGLIARAYEEGGAAALSVLTDEKYFRGSLADLESARSAVSLPLLRKDFTIDAYHVHQAAARGADAILLIAAILTERELRDFRELAERYQMAALVEVHEEEELKAAVASGARIIGVNNRNLNTFDVDLTISLRLAEKMTTGVVKIAESGIHSRADVERLLEAGYQALLVGEHLMKSADPAHALRALPVMMVKICGITNREDALAAVEEGASAIGFNFYRDSPRYISPTGAAMIAEKIPAAVWKVGVFVDEMPETIAKIVLEVGLDVAQLHGLSEARGLRIWRALPAGAPPADESTEAAEALLIDTPSQELRGGTGKTWNWADARRYHQKIIIAGGLDASNVRQAIQEAQPWGVDACSRLEKSPGLKDREKMRNFVKAALSA